jgi:hypothetical protein
MLPNLTNMLSWWQWALVGAVPAAIILLYFLKLKRQPVEVPSTYLWHKSIEDLHVNSIWQKLRQSLLLFLQLLLIFLAILSLLRPSWSGEKKVGTRSIFVIDNSASMSATDVTPGEATSRLEEAKRQVLALIDQMEGGDVAMVISFSNRPSVEQPFTDDRGALRRVVERIQPTNRPTDIVEALRIASGMANPGRSGTDPGRDVMVAEAQPADLYLFTDGKFPHPSFPLGHLTPKYIKIGSDAPKNVAIASLAAERRIDRPNEVDVFALLENYGPDDVEVRIDLLLDDKDQNASTTVEIPGRHAETGAPGSNGVDFRLANVEAGVIKLVAHTKDDLPLDDAAWVAINLPRKAKVLLVSPGNEFLTHAFATGQSRRLTDLTLKTPDYLATKEYRALAQAGVYDLVIFDRCRPTEKDLENDDDNTATPMPECNTFFIGAVPKLALWGWEPGKPWPPQEVIVPKIIDVARTHPLMQLIELDDVLVASGIPIVAKLKDPARPAEGFEPGPPAGGIALLETVGSRKLADDKYESVPAPLMAVAPRGGHEDAIMGFSLLDKDGANTNWMRRRSFPTFIYNILKYLGGGRAVGDAGIIRPGEPVELKIETAAEKLIVFAPEEQAGQEILPSRQSVYRLTGLEKLGPYALREPTGAAVGRFAVNLFDSRESDLRPVDKIDFEWNKVEAEAAFQPERKETWKWLLLLALGVLIFEWYIYNRRVYL